MCASTSVHIQTETMSVNIDPPERPYFREEFGTSGTTPSPGASTRSDN